MQFLVIRFIRWAQGCFRNFAIVCCLTLIAGLVATTPADAVIRRVDHESQAINPDGDPWTDSYPFLSDALADADPGDVIWLADGDYKPDQNTNNPNGTCGQQTGCNRAIAFKLKKDVVVLGGFQGLSHPSGGETQPDRRDPETWMSVLSGDLAGDDADTNANGIPDGFEADPPDYGDMAENSIHVVVALSTEGNVITESTQLDGVWVRAGNASDTTVPYAAGVRGAGLFCGGMNPQTGGPDHFANIKSSPTVARTKFEFNHAGSSEGTGYAAAIYTSYGDPVLRDLCTFADNHSANCAGATVIEFAGVFTALNCTYQDNVASRNGGAHTSRGNSELTIFESCRFVGNRTTHPEVGNGGALRLVSAASELTNCELRENSSPMQGGAAHVQNTTMTNCTVSGNTTSGTPTDPPGGGGIWVSAGPLTIKNTLVWGNASFDGDPQNPQPVGTTLQQQISSFSGPSSFDQTTTYSNIQTGAGDPAVVPGMGNINANPEFKGTDNLRLTKCSPCIDKGLNSAVPLDEFDLDDDGDTLEETPDADILPRLVDGDADSNDDIDMGAYEYDPDCPPTCTRAGR